MTTLFSLLLATQALWTAKCDKLVCTFDGSASTGAIRSYNWSFGDGTPSSSGKIVGHTFATPGSYKVLLRVYDGAKYAQLTQTVTVANVLVIHDTIRIPPQIITRTVYDTAWKHDTVAVQLTLPHALSGIVVDSLVPKGRQWGVWSFTLCGTLDRRDGRYSAFRAPTPLDPTVLSTLPKVGVYPTLAQGVAAVCP